MRRLWCELAWLGGDDVEPGVEIELADGLIAGVSRADAPSSEAERLGGLTLPGLANAHSHAFQRKLRGRTQAAGEGSFWTWREQMYELAATLDPDSMYRLARATFAEMALAGITLVGEFHYVHHAPGGTPYDDPNAMGHALLRAGADAGVRMTLLDTCYLRGGIDQELDSVQERFSDGDAEMWARRVDAIETSGTARVGAAIHSVRAVDPDSARMVADWAEEREAPLHAHVSEQPAENEVCVAAYGRTPTMLLAGAGALNDRFTAVHATHLTVEDIRSLGEAGATCCLCPTTERDLADGIGPARALRVAGARLALGSDSHAVIDLFEEARAVELDERLASGVRGNHSGAELMAAATDHGYRCLGWPEGGRIGVGALADLVTVSLDSVRLAGTTREHALDAAAFAGSGADVTDVIVAGEFIVRDGAHAGIDVARELAEAVDQ